MEVDGRAEEDVGVPAARLAPEGIPVYEVRPGIIRTDMTSGVVEKYDRFIADGAQFQPLATSIPPQSPVAWSCFTSSDASACCSLASACSTASS